jgi:hypothetical protein
MCLHRAGRGRRRLRLPESSPPGLSHSILTGTLIDAPRSGRNPVGQPGHPSHGELLIPGGRP